MFGGTNSGHAFEAATLTNQRTTNFHACEQGKCQGSGPSGGTNVVGVPVGPFQGVIFYRIGDTPNGVVENSMAGGTDPGADSQLGTGLVDHINSPSCIPGRDARCVDDTNDPQPCGLFLPSNHVPGDSTCSSRTTVIASTAAPKRIYQGDWDKGGLIILDERITGSNFSVNGTGFGTPSADSFTSWAYNAGGVECPAGYTPPCRIHRIDYGVTSLYMNGNAGFKADESSRTGYIINSITDGDGKLIGHIRINQSGQELSNCTGWTANTGVYGSAATCNVITVKDPSGASMTRGVVIDGRATGWSHTDISFNPGGGTSCGSAPTEAQLETCGSWGSLNRVTTFKATGPIWTTAQPIPFEASGNKASNCIFRGSITSTSPVCDNVKFDDGTMGEPASPYCAGLLVGPTDQHGNKNGSTCNDIN